MTDAADGPTTRPESWPVHRAPALRCAIGSIGPVARVAVLAVLAGCGAASQNEPVEPPPGLPEAVAAADFYDAGAAPEAKVELGRLLYFDKVLSGNRNIACATCHHPTLATTDAVPLGLGEGPSGLGPDRRPGREVSTAVHARIPRNSPALFNVGAREFERMFHDGRVETDPEGFYEGGFITPAKWKLPPGLENVLAAQAMFPVASPDEMAGQKGENEIADLVSLNRVAGPGGVWDVLAGRLRAIPEYVEGFREAFPDRIQSAEDITYVDAANAIAAFETAEFRSHDSPFDRYLEGERTALTPAQGRGMHLFYGEAGCASCHSGKFQTDHDFHAIAMPQLGPGKGDGSHPGYWRASGERAFLEDLGRGRVTVRPEDNFRFRTPSLRNVAITGPWGHAGAYPTLEAVVRHHLDPVGHLDRYTMPQDHLPAIGEVLELTMTGSRLSQDWLPDARRASFLERDDWVQRTPELRGRIARANELDPVPLTDREIQDLVAFLEALTSPDAMRLDGIVPRRVPSGLPVDR